MKGVAQSGTVAFPQQLSLFYAGKIAPHLGAFLQVTYANDSGTFGIDNTDLRFAKMEVLPQNQSLIYGVSLNNNPTVQDLWNSTPAFGFPYASSNAAVSPLAATAIDGTFAQEVGGISAYAFWNESVYANLAGIARPSEGRSTSSRGLPARWTARPRMSFRAYRHTGVLRTRGIGIGTPWRWGLPASTSSCSPEARRARQKRSPGQDLAMCRF